VKRGRLILGAVISFGACIYLLEAAILQDWLSGFPDAQVGVLTKRGFAFLGGSVFFFLLAVWLTARAYRCEPSRIFRRLFCVSQAAIA
jgi:hypothetical protein